MVLSNIKRLILLLVGISISITTSSAEWAPINWIWKKQPDGGYKRTSMLLPAHITGSDKTYYFNIDTGASRSLLYKNIVFSDTVLSKILNNSSRRSIPNGFPNVMDYGLVLDGKVANTEFSKNPFLLHTVAPNMKSDVIGVVGLDAFSLPVLSIDYIIGRVLVTNDVSEVEFKLQKKIRYGKYVSISGLPSIAISMMGKTQGQYILDTGLTISDAVVFDLTSWKRMTGRELDDFRNRKKHDFTLGRSFNCTSAPALLNMDFGSITLGKLVIDYCLRDGIPMKERGFDGMIGGPSFYDKAVIVFDTKNQQIGFSFSEENKK